ncbi:MAG: carboxy terminal-processing peptidase [Opitutaceae bacterium]|nr:carboxy terminal-processing peptidase [Opitutaceae bacterium]
MPFASPLFRLLTRSAGLLLLATTALVAADRKFTTSPVLATEASTMVKFLEQWHYNREAVRSSDFDEVPTDYMEVLDGQKLFFLGSDQAAFQEKYAKSKLYWDVSALGKIDAAYEIYAVYEKRATERVNWIFDALQQPFDFGTNETYRADRSKSDWPANPEAADELWRQRLKFELIAELLNKKTEDEAKQVVRKRYERMLKNLAEIEGSDLAELFLSTIARLYDPHSTYFSAETYEDFGIQMKLELVGIGALLGLEEDYCVVKEIVPGGPADLGRQLKPSDRIISVKQEGGEPVEIIGMKLRKIVDLIRGPKHSKVTLLVQPGEATDSSARHEIVITRDVVKLNSARAHAALFEVPDGAGATIPMGVITLPSFYGPASPDETGGEKTSASHDVARLLEQLLGAGAKGIVLDLRRNGGGFLSEATQLTGLFIKQGPVVQVKASSGEIALDSDESPAIAYDGPLAVLVDRMSASASEIVAGALQNYGRAIVIGDSSTHGKGSVQTVLEMKDLVPQLMRTPIKTGATKITVQKYYLPSGASTQLKGVVPDIVLPSVTDYLPIGESDLPHALVWDEIPTSFFDGSPLDPKLVSLLRQRSLERQDSLAEFGFLRREVDWFKSRQEQKLIPLNLEVRRQQREADAAFRKEMKATKEQLAQQDFTYREFHLVPPPPKPALKAPEKTDADPEDEAMEALSTDGDGSYAKVDVPLRESFRVIVDALNLGQNGEHLADNRLPLTARYVNKG